MRAVAGAPGWSLAGLITLPTELAGRHSDFVDLGEEAQAAGARIMRSGNGNSAEVIDFVRAIEPDMMFVIGWSQICGADFIAAARGRMIGYHPAPLPQLRGRGVLPWTILLGHGITASTLFWIDGGLDSGPILAQRFLHVAPNETVGSLYARHMEALAALMEESLPLIDRGTAPRVPQDERHASWAARRTPDDGRIDWTRTAGDIERLVRAVGHPYPGAFTTLRGERLTIWHAEFWPDASRHFASPGQVMARDERGFAVRCGDGGGLWISEWSHGKGPPPIHVVLGRD